MHSLCAQDPIPAGDLPDAQKVSGWASFTKTPACLSTHRTPRDRWPAHPGARRQVCQQGG